MSVTVDREIHKSRTGGELKFLHIKGNNMQELIKESLKYIRERSREHYKKSLESQFVYTDTALIDHHAGNGFYIYVRYNGNYSEVTRKNPLGLVD